MGGIFGKQAVDLFIPPTYSTKIHELCPRCHATQAFPLAPPEQILSHFGYC